MKNNKNKNNMINEPRTVEVVTTLLPIVIRFAC